MAVLVFALAWYSEPWKRQKELQRVTFTDLAARLSSGTAFIDVVRARLFEPSPEGHGQLTVTPHYEAFVLRHTDSAPGYALSWVHLGPAAPIDAAVRAWREVISASNLPPDVDDTLDQRVRQLVWEPLEPYVADCSAVLILPDAALTGVPWAALPADTPGTWLVEKYAFGLATSGQQLGDLLTREAPRGDNVLLVGGVDYGQNPNLEGGGPYTFLNGTSQEVHGIAALWDQPATLTLLEGLQADEPIVALILPSARYVHLATHGFFATGNFRTLWQADESLASGGIPMTGSRSTSSGRNPLTLSGIVLAGANNTVLFSADDAAQFSNGLLTAEKVANMNLANTELAVLSACETGLGEVAGGEGVFGLQRAFGLAGARTVVASLWSVPDQPTQQLMTAFYDNLWVKKLDRLEALRQAQLIVLHDPVLEAAPKYFRTQCWAAWVMSGDPGDPAKYANRPTIQPAAAELAGAPTT